MAQEGLASPWGGEDLPTKSRKSRRWGWGHGDQCCRLGWEGSDGTSKGISPCKEKSRRRSPEELHEMTERSCFPADPVYARALLAWLCQQVWKPLIEAQPQQPNFSADQAAERARTLWCVISSAGPARLGCVFHLKSSYSNPIPSKQTNNRTSEQTTPWEGWLIRAQRGAERGGTDWLRAPALGLFSPLTFILFVTVTRSLQTQSKHLVWFNTDKKENWILILIWQ